MQGKEKGNTINEKIIPQDSSYLSGLFLIKSYTSYYVQYTFYIQNIGIVYTVCLYIIFFINLCSVYIFLVLHFKSQIVIYIYCTVKCSILRRFTSLKVWRCLFFNNKYPRRSCYVIFVPYFTWILNSTFGFLYVDPER